MTQPEAALSGLKIIIPEGAAFSAAPEGGFILVFFLVYLILDAITYSANMQYLKHQVLLLNRLKRVLIVTKIRSYFRKLLFD